MAEKQEHNNNRKNKQKYEEIQSKVFEHKLSPLTVLLKVKDFKTIYHIFIFMLITLFINNFANDYIKHGEIRLGLHIITSTFGNLHIVAAIWILLFTLSLLCYATFVNWAKLRCQMKPNSSEVKILDNFGITLVVMYYVLLMYLPAKLMLRFDLPLASSSIVLAEKVRYLMKSHAFIRDNAAKVIKYKVHSEKQVPYPTFTHYLYFLFAPTMVYRDEYPRAKSIDWYYVAKCFIEVLATIFYMCFVLDHFFFQDFKDTCKGNVKLTDMLLKILLNTIPAFLVILCAFYCLLHAWMNGFAEMLRFGDREFYKDWWNSNTYARYYRTWNTVVHDWLHTYVYKDFYDNVFVHNKVASKLMVFLISAIFHEYIITLMLRFFFPVLFLKFSTFGVLLTFISQQNVIGNIFMWYSLAMGFSSVLSLYTIEYFARINCPVEGALIDYFVPRFLSCKCF